jgi:hypothetical protein
MTLDQEANKPQWLDLLSRRLARARELKANLRNMGERLEDSKAYNYRELTVMNALDHPGRYLEFYVGAEDSPYLPSI